MRNFESQTKEISVLVHAFSTRYRGIKNAKSGELILLDLRGTGQSDIMPQLFRKLLGHIRKNDLLKPGFVLSSDKSGYWLSFDKEEQNEYLHRELNRMSNQFGNLESLRNRLISKKEASAQIQTTLF